MSLSRSLLGSLLLFDSVVSAEVLNCLFFDMSGCAFASLSRNGRQRRLRGPDIVNPLCLMKRCLIGVLHTLVCLNHRWHSSS